MQSKFLKIQLTPGCPKYLIQKTEVQDFVSKNFVNLIKNTETRFIFAFATIKHQIDDIFVVCDWVGLQDNIKREFTDSTMFLIPKQHAAQPRILLPCCSVEDVDDDSELEIISINNIIQKLFSNKV